MEKRHNKLVVAFLLGCTHFEFYDQSERLIQSQSHINLGPKTLSKLFFKS